MSQVVTELNITSDTSGADQFAASMDKAGGSAKDTSLAIAGVSRIMADSLAAFATGGVIVAGVVAVTDYIAKLNGDLGKLAGNAKLAGVSLADFQSLKFAGNVTGLSDEQFNAGLQRSAALLADAARNSNTLTKEFELNGMSLKNSNGSLITQAELIEKSGKLMLGLTSEQDKVKLAGYLGLTREWIPLLEQAGRNFSIIGDEAQRAGVIISDDTIEKATEFDKEWRRSSIAFSANMKAAMSELLPYVNQLIERGLEFARTFNREEIEKVAKAGLQDLARPLGLEDDMAIKIEVTPETERLRAVVQDIQAAGTLWEKVTLGLSALQGGLASGAIFKPPAKVSLVDPEPYMPHPLAGADPNMYGSEYKPTITNAQLSSWEKHIQQMRDLTEAHTKLLQSGGAVNDSVDRAINTLNRHVGQQEADTRCAGGGVAAFAKLRAQAARPSPANDNDAKAAIEAVA